MNLKTTLYFLIFCLLFFTSCQKEISQVIQTSTGEVLDSSSAVTLLVKKMVTKDGSKDNIIDNASCITVQLPVTVIVNGTQMVVSVEQDYNAVEAIFDASSIDIDSLQIVFPIVITLSDFSEISINNYDSLNEYSKNCNGNNQNDNDIECIDFVYPIYLSVFNSESQITQTVTIENDAHFYQVVEAIATTQIIEIQFPLKTILYNDTEIVINDMNTLQNAIEKADNMCDEDDDNDYNDDDCINCSETEIKQLLVDVCDWKIHELITNEVENTKDYEDYLFTFLEDGTVVVNDDSNNFEGSWLVYTSNFQIIVEINFPNFPNLTFKWGLNKIDDDGEIYLYLGNNKLEFKKECD